MGPMAQDFYRIFKLGDSNRRIHQVDADGVALIALSGFYDVIQESERELKALHAEILAYTSEIEQLEHEILVAERPCSHLRCVPRNPLKSGLKGG